MATELRRSIYVRTRQDRRGFPYQQLVNDNIKAGLETSVGGTVKGKVQARCPSRMEDQNELDKFPS